MAKRLYVGNLAFGVTSDELRELFEGFGIVKSSQVLIDRESGRSRGFGFIEMEDDREAETAIEQLDGSEHRNRRLNVNEAQPRATGVRGYSGEGRRVHGRSTGGHRNDASR
jgi:RNA recognition motif-containing protein